MKLIGLPATYRFPENPTGFAVDNLDGDMTPYHQENEDEVVVLIKSHNPSFESTCMLLSIWAFREQYTTVS